MSLRSSMPNRPVQSQQELRSSIGDRTTIMADNPHLIALEQLVPAIKQMSRNAASVDRIPVYYYQRKKLGRRCSCFVSETSPDGTCKICHGTGRTGGYTKFGTRDQSLSAASVWQSSGVRIDYTKRPNVIVLEDGCIYGELFTTWNLGSNNRLTDLVRILKHGDVTVAIKNSLSPDDAWVELNTVNLNSVLASYNVDVRVTLKRATPDSLTPVFMVADVRYNVIKELLVSTDWPIRSQSITLAEYGIYDSWQTVTIFFDDTINNIDVEDWLINSRDGTRWKVTEVRPNRPLGILTSTEITARQIQSYEAYSSIPQ